MNHLSSDRHRLALSVAFWLMVFTSTGFSEEGVWRITGTPGSRCNRVISCGDSQRVLWDLAGSDALYPAIGRSTDGGESWTRVRCMPDGEFRSAAGSRSDPPELYYLTNAGLFRFDNSSSDWLEIGPGGLQITVDPNYSSRLILETETMTLESTDSGVTWHRFGIPRFEIACVRFASGHPGAMVCSDREQTGIFFTPGDGHLRQLGIPAQSFYPYILHVTSDLTIYASTQNQLFRYDPAGTAWVTLNPLPSEITEIDSTEGIVLVTQSNGSFQISRNRGITWSPVLAGHIGVDVEVNRSEIFLGTSDGLFISSNNLENFTLIDDRIVLPQYWDLFFDSRNPHEIYASGERICRSTDDGETWMHLADLPGGGSGTLKQSRYEPQIWYLRSDSIYYSSDDMQTWQTIRSDSTILRLVGIKPNRTAVFDWSEYVDTSDGNYPYYGFTFYEPSEDRWSGGWSFYGLLEYGRGNGTMEHAFIFKVNHGALYATKDSFSSFYHPETTPEDMTNAIPIDNNPDEAMIVQYGRLHRFNLITGNQSPRENIDAKDLAYLSMDDYLIAADRLYRSDTLHTEPIPVGDFSIPITRLFMNPYNPNELFAVLNSGGIAVGRIDSSSPVPDPPCDVRAESVSEREIRVNWQNTADASNVRIYVTGNAGMEMIHTVRAIDQEAWIDVKSLAETSLTATVKLSACNSSGREGTSSAPIVIPIGRQDPEILMAGFRTSSISGDSGGRLIINGYIRDRQGNDTISAVRLALNGSILDVSLYDDSQHGDGSDRDGIFGAIMDIPPGLPLGTIAIEIIAVDNEGHHSRSPIRLTCRDGRAQ